MSYLRSSKYEKRRRKMSDWWRCNRILAGRYIIRSIGYLRRLADLPGFSRAFPWFLSWHWPNQYQATYIHELFVHLFVRTNSDMMGLCIWEDGQYIFLRSIIFFSINWTLRDIKGVCWEDERGEQEDNTRSESIRFFDAKMAVGMANSVCDESCQTSDVTPLETDANGLPMTIRFPSPKNPFADNN